VAILDIRVLGDPVLRERTKPVAQVTDELRTLAQNMFETMYAAEGIGLAAPQVGRTERIFVMDVDDHPYVMINPEIVSREGSERGEEGCLSIPDIYGDVDRSAHVVARAMDLDGNTYELEASGLLARCIQHELDHLDGKLFIDYMSMLKRKFVARKWEKEATKYPGYVRTITPGADRKRRSRSRETTPSAIEPPFEPEL
jgi:peptide deformylase